MEVVVAECAGACYGVKRALDLAQESIADGSSAQTLGALIHNTQVVDDLRSRGVSVAESPADVVADKVIVRSHGVTPDMLEALQNTNAQVVDATCPHVLRAQQAAYRLSQDGNTVLIVGEQSHPEVQGLYAWAQRGRGRIEVVLDSSLLPHDLSDPIGVVMQTTQPRAVLEGVVEALQARGMHPTVCDTICSSTDKRQKAAAELAAKVDAMVIVGGHASSNTTRLFEICRDLAPHAFHVESASELNKDAFVGMHTVGVTAGASTPDDQIAAVVDCLRSWC